MVLTVIGSGAWGLALAQLCEANGHQVVVWSRRSKLSLETAIAQGEIIISAVSMAGVRATAQQLQSLSLNPEAILVTATKGLDLETGATPSQIWQSTLPNHSVVVLSGPNLSKEISRGLPAATVVASSNLAAAISVQNIFASKNFRVYTNSDPIGVELGGTLKNVIAIAVGVCDGLKLGTNAKAALITRSLPEIMQVGKYFGAQPETFWGLSGLGDLLATCSSNLSRNYQVGFGLGEGKNLEQILQDLEGTAEGVNTARVLHDLTNRTGLTLPICGYVYRLLNGEITPIQAVAGLMDRDLKAEL
ncbi:glycerol-3-phosphate dehydrogenase [Synechococcus sp. PCC 7502]|uniref:NAD(P)H-dependent glycerol-3-phosphate dehydrogenase n=1 Tax=Synechococcus sp. PCC 7502 TaxID=1173263 RepID=UPI00029F97C3|nr:NAD(P)H-dependent glycerol-3-phosphate dehydrogenase [Synechococcus sp. PCC 7502]AFY72732.1 glycerol-3-phosphate dehydrogenase [Synechococcus sp. PCC 7502]